MRTLLVIAFLVGLLMPVEPVFAQADYGFRFVRIRFSDPRARGSRFGGAAWAHDYPAAEENFYTALKRTTAIHVEEPYLILELDDNRIFEYPILYLCEPAYWNMTGEEVERLREYLNRGGFILFDDFGGQREWFLFYEQMKRVFPDLEPEEISPDHPIWDI